MRIFSGEKRISELNPRVGVFTAAANTGFDIPNLALVVRVGFPPDLLTMIQEKGRLVQMVGSTGDYVVLVSMKTFLATRLLIDTHNEEEKEDMSYGAGTLMHEQHKCQTVESEETPVASKSTSDNLSEKEMRNCKCLRQSMFMDVVRLCCLNLGCLQHRLELFLSSGKLDRIPDIGDNTSCGNRYPVCNN